QAGDRRAANVLGRGARPLGGDERDQVPGDLGRVRVGLVDLHRHAPVAADRRRGGPGHARVGSPRVRGNGHAVHTGALLRKHGPVAPTAALHSFGGGLVGCVQVALLWNMPSEPGSTDRVQRVSWWECEKGLLTWEYGGCEASHSPRAGGTFSMRSSQVVLDQVDITFDDPRAVAHAGLLLPATLAERLGIEQATDELVDLGDRTGAAHPGRKLLTLVHAMVAGADCIDDVELLRCGSTASILGHRVRAASTVGTWLRGFTFGHVRQLDKMTGEVLARAWGAGAGPGDGPLAVDVDSTICEVCGYHKQGACYGYTRRLGYHPLLATRADSGEVLHARLRKGSANTARGILRFVDELVARLRRAGASGELTLRADSGFWSAKLIKRLRGHRVRYSITVRQTKTVRAAIAA